MERDAKSFPTLEGLTLQALISLQLRNNLKFQVSYLETLDLFIIPLYKTII